MGRHARAAAPTPFTIAAVTLANRITLFRLALIPFVVAAVGAYRPGDEWIRYLAFGLYALAAASDGIDGYVARHYDQRSRLGTALDPLADKLLVNLTYIFLAVNDVFEEAVPKWIPPILLGRDVFITGGAYIIKHVRGAVHIRPTLLGKATMVLQSLGVAVVLLQWRYAETIVAAMLACVALSWIEYCWHGLQQMRAPREGGHEPQT